MIRPHHLNTPHPPRLSAFPRTENMKGGSPAISLLNLSKVPSDLALSMTAGKKTHLSLRLVLPLAVTIIALLVECLQQ